VECFGSSAGLHIASRGAEDAALIAKNFEPAAQT
jgi:hypothetical protein